MITSRITFVLEQDGFTGWQLQKFKQLTHYFQSIFVLYNISRDNHAKLSDPLRVLSLGSCRHDLFQLAIEGVDSELASIVLSEYIREHATLVSTTHKKNHNANQLLAQHPIFDLQFDYQWISRESQTAKDKTELLHFLANVVSPASEQPLLHQLTKREQVSSTAIAGGIALPHVVTAHVSQPTFCSLILKSPLSWESQLGDVTLILAIFLPQDLERQWIRSVTRLTRWLISTPEHGTLLHANREETVKSILLHVMASEFFDPH